MMQQNKLSTKAFLNQAIFEMKKGLYKQAVENFNIVIEENNELGPPFVLRSRCQMMWVKIQKSSLLLNQIIDWRLENNTEAQEDAQKALQVDPHNVKALLAKAESLFASGKFELGISYHS